MDRISRRTVLKQASRDGRRCDGPPLGHCTAGSCRRESSRSVWESSAVPAGSPSPRISPSRTCGSRTSAIPTRGGSPRRSWQPRPTTPWPICAGFWTTSRSTPWGLPRPDHWHGPATILACDAGKHVYVEKPCTHNIREGRLMIEAAPRDNHVVQVGSQTRGTAAFATRSNCSAGARSAMCWSGRPGPARSGPVSAAPSPAIRPPGSITTCGSVPPPCGRSSRTASPALGTGGTPAHRRHGQSRRSRHRRCHVGSGCRHHPSRSPGPAESCISTTTEHSPTRSTYVSSFPAMASTSGSYHLRATDLVALAAGRIRRRQRLLRHGRVYDPLQTHGLEAVRSQGQVAQGRGGPVLGAGTRRGLPGRDSLEPAALCRHRDRPSLGYAGEVRRTSWPKPDASDWCSIRKRSVSSATRRPTPSPAARIAKVTGLP